MISWSKKKKKKKDSESDTIAEMAHFKFLESPKLTSRKI